MSACWASLEIAGGSRGTNKTKRRKKGETKYFNRSMITRMPFEVRPDISSHCLVRMQDHVASLCAKMFKSGRGHFGSKAIRAAGNAIKEGLESGQPSGPGPSPLIALIIPLRDSNPRGALAHAKFLQNCQYRSNRGPVAIAELGLVSWQEIVRHIPPGSSRLQPPQAVDYIAMTAGDFCNHLYFSCLRLKGVMQS